MSNLTNRLLRQLEQTIVTLGAAVPPAPSPFNRDERIVQLFDILRLNLGNGVVTATLTLPVPTSGGHFAFIADRPMRLVQVQYVHNVRETSAPVMGIQVVVGDFDQVAGSGAFALTTPFNGRSLSGVLQNGALNSDPGFTTIPAGGRLSLSILNTPTELRGLHVTASLMPIRT
jgi:hypothetical protein